MFVGLSLAAEEGPAEPELFGSLYTPCQAESMAALAFARSTLCSSCIHRMVGDDISHLWFPFYRQLRGKKKSAKRPTTINVKLLEDIIGFGRKGNAHHHRNCQYLC